MSLWTLAAPAEFAQEIKKSRFQARASSVDSAAAALQFVAQSTNVDARHNCWAYRIGGAYRWSDADEPAGTAGRPILSAIDGQQLDRVVVLVARWFGGIKLGAGGLVRAYGGTAAECLRTAQRVALVAQSKLAIRLGFEWLGVAHAAFDQFNAVKLTESFDSDGVCLHVQIAAGRAAQLVVALRDATRGSARTKELD